MGLKQTLAAVKLITLKKEKKERTQLLHLAPSTYKCQLLVSLGPRNTAFFPGTAADIMRYLRTSTSG